MDKQLATIIRFTG